MEIPKKALFPVVGIFVLVACSPTEAWYKQVAGPSYYSVGRASGLLSGIRRSPYVRRAELEPSHSGETASNSVFSAPVCVTHISPNLQSCKLLHEIKGSFVCRAHVFISPDSSDCERSRAVKLVPGLDDGTYSLKD